MSRPNPNSAKLDEAADAHTQRVRRRILRARQIAKLSQSELAVKSELGRTRSPIEKLENGPAVPSPDRVARIARATGLDISFFYDPALDETDTAPGAPLGESEPSRLAAVEKQLAEAMERLDALEARAPISVKPDGAQ